MLKFGRDDEVQHNIGVSGPVNPSIGMDRAVIWCVC